MTIEVIFSSELLWFYKNPHFAQSCVGCYTAASKIFVSASLVVGFVIGAFVLFL